MLRLLLVLWMSLLLSCERRPTSLDEHRRHPGRQRSSHPVPAPALVDRVGNLQGAVLDYLVADGARNGIAARPRPHTLTTTERNVVAATLAGLPPEVRVLAERFVAAIYFAQDLGTSGWAEFFDPPARQSFLVFDQVVLHETANAWATRRERSGFTTGADIRVELAEPATDAPGGAFRFIFLHELGHAVAHGLRLLPTWVDSSGPGFPYVGVVAGEEPFTPAVPFYAAGGKLLPASEARNVYARWSVSPHATLYATLDLQEDFAETFASYIHVSLLQQPYRISVASDYYGNGILFPRTAHKRAFIAHLLRPAATRAEGELRDGRPAP